MPKNLFIAINAIYLLIYISIKTKNKILKKATLSLFIFFVLVGGVYSLPEAIGMGKDAAHSIAKIILLIYACFLFFLFGTNQGEFEKGHLKNEFMAIKSSYVFWISLIAINLMAVMLNSFL